MRTITNETSKSHAIKKIKFQANIGIWDGKEDTVYFEDCRWYLDEFKAVIIFTRDTGHHSSGWWKNPEYERCYHLSITFQDKFGNSKSKNEKRTAIIVNRIFGDFKKMLWSEPPYSEIGIKKDCWHYRLFCLENWTPIIPKGEVYSKELTDAGWHSYSEKNYHKHKNV